MNARGGFNLFILGFFFIAFLIALPVFIIVGSISLIIWSVKTYILLKNNYYFHVLVFKLPNQKAEDEPLVRIFQHLEFKRLNVDENVKVFFSAKGWKLTIKKILKDKNIRQTFFITDKTELSSTTKHKFICYRLLDDDILNFPRVRLLNQDEDKYFNYQAAFKTGFIKLIEYEGKDDALGTFMMRNNYKETSYF